ncbi:HvfC/BufC N-terminal domain-containing protein [Piscinibacter sakaiensis]|uniref:Conserved domain protein n=1 Tax=Piscinibacter sakaiensis TaxID=1547922 RepID=A0A0K8P1Z7_PISS1|nr:DNA-binding domain-containing protein [Piscinibacter sakaiensis]GAP36682.1 conserved domain protein [Piscinibacter sakaiensis]
MNAAATEAAFAAALLDPTRPPPPGLRAWNGSDVGPRFDVHRNNLLAGRIEGLAETYPALRRALGDAVFRAIAAAHVRRCPPRSPVLYDYGGELAEELAAQAPLADAPWLPDLARLEWARQCAALAADAEPLAPAAIAEALAAPEALLRRRVRLHPSLTVLASRHAVVSLWAAHEAEDLEAALAAIDPDRPEAAAVLRAPDDAVWVLPLAPADAAFLAALQAGQCWQAAWEAAAARPALPRDEAAPPFDPVPLLAALIRHGALVGWLDAPPSPTDDPRSSA